jgi:hypothetical protein
MNCECQSYSETNVSHNVKYTTESAHPPCSWRSKEYTIDYWYCDKNALVACALVCCHGLPVLSLIYSTKSTCISLAQVLETRSRIARCVKLCKVEDVGHKSFHRDPILIHGQQFCISTFGPLDMPVIRLFTVSFSFTASLSVRSCPRIGSLNHSFDLSLSID